MNRRPCGFAGNKFTPTLISAFRFGYRTSGIGAYRSRLTTSPPLGVTGTQKSGETYSPPNPGSFERHTPRNGAELVMLPTVAPPVRPTAPMVSTQPSALVFGHASVGPVLGSAHVHAEPGASRLQHRKSARAARSLPSTTRGARTTAGSSA